MSNWFTLRSINYYQRTNRLTRPKDLLDGRGGKGGPLGWYGFNLRNESLLLQGYALAWSEGEDISSMVLLKYFATEYKEDWIREVDVAKSLCSERKEFPFLLNYRWHSTGKWIKAPCVLSSERNHILLVWFAVKRKVNEHRNCREIRNTFLLFLSVLISCCANMIDCC